MSITFFWLLLYYFLFCFFIFCCFCEVFAVGCALFFSVFEYFFGYIKLKIWNIYSSNKLLVIQFIWLMCYNSCNSLFSQPLRNSDKNQIQIFFRHFFWKILLSLWNMIWRSWSDQFLSIQWHLNDCCCLVNGSSVQCTHSLLVIVFIPERRQNVATFHSALKFFKKLQLFGKSAKKINMIVSFKLIFEFADNLRLICRYFLALLEQCTFSV